jgi:diguanylate cyclase (GGDEF)-like protein
LLVAQALHLGSAAAWAEPGVHTAAGVPASALVLLAVVGGPAVLLIMLVASRLEAQMRQSLDEAKQRLSKQRQLDPLTLLPGRALFETQLLDAAHAVDAQGGSLALMVINLDGFKPLNESFGHDKGDLMLREEAERLRALSGPQVAVARLGADAFLLLHSGNPSEEQTVALANRVLLELGKACMVGGREAVLSCSVGIALYPQHGAVTTLLAHAELAMRAAKATGGAAYAFFEAHMASGVKDQMDLLRELRGALTGRQLSVYYQPKVHAPSGDITGAEALMRWNHPKRGLISPEVFIPIAERFGLIGALGNWLIDEVCQQIHLWREEGLRMRVAINLSVHQLRQTDLPDRIAQALQRNGVNPDLLTCEITETVAMEDIQSTQQVFARLAQVGVHIAIDDFGTGYSSLAYLRKLPAEELKIDRSFVHDLATSADARAVVDAVVKLAQALGLKLVAEGVETQEQFEILRSLGCHELQGFYFAKPMSAKALGLWAISDSGPSNVGFRHSLFEETKPAPMG